MCPFDPYQFQERPVPEVVQRWADAWNTADAQGMAELFTENEVYQDFAFGAKIKVRRGWRAGSS